MITLNTPSVYPVNAFDPSYPHTFAFYYSGNQAVSNRIIITDNLTQKQIYDNRQDGLKLNHTVPANTMESGKSYTVRVQIFDADDNYSNFSDGVLFYCYTAPLFYFSNVNNNDFVSEANLTLSLCYSQPENELLNEYVFYLYDSSKNQLYTSGSFHTENNLTHTVYGLSNNTAYYIRALGKTKRGMSIDTGYIKINVKYNTVKANFHFEATNDKKTGCVTLKTNVLTVGYRLANNNFVLGNGEVTLDDNILTYEAGTDGDLTLIVQARQIPLGQFLKTTDDAISLKIVRVSNIYYAALSVNTGAAQYNIFREITGATLVTDKRKQVIDSCDNHIVVADPANYNQNAPVTFVIHKKNNVYDIAAYYN